MIEAFKQLRKHMDLASWLMIQQVQLTSGSAIEVGQFLSVKSAHCSHTMLRKNVSALTFGANHWRRK